MKNGEKKHLEEKITPSLQFAVLCDGVTAPDIRGKVSFIGVFDKFLRPGIIPNFTLAIGWKNGKGEYTSKVRLLNQDLRQIFETPEMKFILKDETESGRAIINFGQMSFPVPGVYWIEILLDNETAQSIPLPVLEGSA